MTKHSTCYLLLESVLVDKVEFGHHLMKNLSFQPQISLAFHQSTDYPITRWQFQHSITAND